jgi:hypothetical protein
MREKSIPSGKSTDVFWEIVLVILAFFAIRSFLKEEGSGRVVSESGEIALDNASLMSEVEKKLDPSNIEDGKDTLRSVSVNID